MTTEADERVILQRKLMTVEAERDRLRAELIYCRQSREHLLANLRQLYDQARASEQLHDREMVRR